MALYALPPNICQSWADRIRLAFGYPVHFREVDAAFQLYQRMETPDYFEQFFRRGDEWRRALDPEDLELLRNLIENKVRAQTGTPHEYRRA